MVKRLVVGAHYGLRDWLAQRVTAVLMLLGVVYMLLRFAFMSEAGWLAWRTLMAEQPSRVLVFVLFMAAFYHAWVGVRDIWMDYVQVLAVRLCLHVLTIVLLTAYTGWLLAILWGGAK